MTSLTPIQCPYLGVNDPYIAHGFFTRQGGISRGVYESLNTGLSSQDNPHNVHNNRKKIIHHLGLGSIDCVTVWQHHSSDVVIATENWADHCPKADGIVTNTPNLPIAIMTADCGPVLFCDNQNRIIGAAHAGWRGATTGILESVVEKMIHLGAIRKHIHATLGPTISVKNYEVGPEFIDNIINLDGNNHCYLSSSETSKHAYFDLPSYIVDHLAKLGVHARWTGQCTYADETLFFSYRRMTHRKETDFGRQMSVIALRSP